MQGRSDPDLISPVPSPATDLPGLFEAADDDEPLRVQLSRAERHGRAVAVIGLGYVGLPTALALRAAGVRVIGIDVSADRLRDIRAGAVDLGLRDRERLTDALHDPAFLLTDDPRASSWADTVMICVPTPVDRHQVPDLGMLAKACASAVAHAVPGQLLLLTSTSYVGTTRDLLLAPLAAKGMKVEADVFVAFAPERIDPGNATHGQDLTPRVVGGEGRRSTASAVSVLSRISPSVHPVGSPEAAEMTKLWENTFRAVNIALANELADNCAVFGLDPRSVIDAAATKPYGFMPFYPGPGVGGHCIPCDPHYLLWQLKAERIPSPVVDAAMRAIAERPGRMAGLITAKLAARGIPVAGARVLVVGIAYKKGVADIRESPALEIMGLLADWGAAVSFTDPMVPRADLRGRTLTAVADPWDQRWDLVVLHTVHSGTDLSRLGPEHTVLDISQDRRGPGGAGTPRAAGAAGGAGTSGGAEAPGGDGAHRSAGSPEVGVSA
ncbi:nucleotide sugar dehydrogenase [Streptomyces sp. NBC_00102]|uniref:nucleotide sugar dehydrogenase n=1 Tax=Streptomyces sp. NBC_00102 TaxID=2975652 RepID=UPI0022558DBE|nr:nucleotide sugar dehydrogenase [Streptomyces sp. NBC_00102]MCX5399838.1 nucleotide sugar dehydrogenase [Streptomyces sp. NBC_00102]